MVESSDVETALIEVEDPEMKMSIIDLGLVYGIRLEDKEDELHCEIDLTLTSPGCPIAPEIMAAVHRAALATEGVDSVHVNLVWSPPWDPRVHASEEAKMDLGLW